MKQLGDGDLDVDVVVADLGKSAAAVWAGQSNDDAQWLDALRSVGPAHAAAVAQLHAVLSRAARFELRRRTATLNDLSPRDCDDLAAQAADDALMSVLERLDSFEGRSRFTTWVYKFAIYEAGVKVRRHSWQGREVLLEPGSWSLMPAGEDGPERFAEHRELLAALEDGIRNALTPHQRKVLVALAITGVPVDVLAERLATTRGALYKTLHDGRRKLRAHLTNAGLGPLADSYLKDKR